jgi:RHS repeat-associated protein
MDSGRAEVSGKRYRYTGKERDEETGLYYHGARYYASWLGRWSSTDPKGLVDGPNRYAYVRGNPIRWKDAKGEQTHLPGDDREVEWWRWPIMGVGALAGLLMNTLTGGEDAANAPGPHTRPIPTLGTAERAVNLAPVVLGAGVAGGVARAGWAVQGVLGGGAAGLSQQAIADARRWQLSPPSAYVRSTLEGAGTGLLLAGTFKAIGAGVGLARRVGFDFASKLDPVSKLEAVEPASGGLSVENLSTPVNGRVNVGGGFERGSESASNLQPFMRGTGGPAPGTDVPNLVEGRFEQIARLFKPGSASEIRSSRLPYGTVDWAESARGAYQVMAPGGRLRLNVWTTEEQQVQTMIDAFRSAGFRNVVNETGLVGAGTVITGVR